MFRKKRCLKGEGKIEKLQTKVLELQRKLDNKTAAVQELGKENQSLQHHCRQCGNIFCAECSAKNALTPSSKKPVCIFDACFSDFQG